LLFLDIYPSEWVVHGLHLSDLRIEGVVVILVHVEK
jgi:hypothetical protein